MATYQKFQDFVEQLCKGIHHLEAAGDVCRVYLSNAVPSASADAIKADLATITEQNGYSASDLANDITEATGTATVTAVDVVWTGTGAGFGPFQYVPTYNDTATSPGADPLINWWDYGSAISVLAAETFTVDFTGSWFTVA